MDPLTASTCEHHDIMCTKDGCIETCDQNTHVHGYIIICNAIFGSKPSVVNVGQHEQMVGQ